MFFDFDPTEGLDDDAVEATLDTNTFNAIVDIISGRDLQVFTTGGEFYVPQNGLDPITPTNFFVKTASRNGIKEGEVSSTIFYLKTKEKRRGYVERQEIDTNIAPINITISDKI